MKKRITGIAVLLAITLLCLPSLSLADTFPHYAYRPVSVYNIDKNVTKTENIHAATIYADVSYATQEMVYNGHRYRVYKGAALSAVRSARGVAGVPDSVGANAGNLSTSYSESTHQLSLTISNCTLYGRSYKSASKQNDSVNPNNYTYSSTFNNFTINNISWNQTLYPMIIE